MFEKLKNDADLWIAIRQDNGLAFNALFDRYWARMYKTAYRQLADEEKSLEVVNDIFLSLWNRRKDLEIHIVSSFLLSSVRYQIYSRLKAAKLSIVYRAEFHENEHLSELNLGESHIQEVELQQELDVYLNQLPKRCKEIFHLSRIEHLSNQDIADRLGISKKTIENQLTIALKHLRMAFKNLASLILFLLLMRF